MCIVIATTAHPSYALILLNNRDEFITRPTSRPHWWSSHQQEILSSRDLQRAEQGTWLGVTKTGNIAVLTNYRESETHDAAHPIIGTKSRGGMVTAWLTASVDETTNEFVHRLTAADGVKGVGGFSLLCGKLRKKGNTENGLEPLAIISNRCDDPEEVPWIADKRGEVYALSNNSYADPDIWYKVQKGKEKVDQAVKDAIEAGSTEEELVSRLFAVLDIQTLPAQNGRPFEEYIYELRNSIFIPLIGSTPSEALPKADTIASANSTLANNISSAKRDPKLKEDERPNKETNISMTGVYGTQRQTIILVDWDGKVTFTERSLWDPNGHPIEMENRDMKFEFHIEGWK
ncbi:hypothetical protein QTJ16_003939 [Diplocarpon rosae]|uniref:Uncharacterized protein n=1 Tax=Diplocarpon rosae TaxID=946125 RepID=A0AAD9WF80_9HELO|nr:hypothetical protein QTJ16_003939 [Diplocarpon rosae]